jgi:hypothetical protein
MRSGQPWKPLLIPPDLSTHYMVSRGGHQNKGIAAALRRAEIGGLTVTEVSQGAPMGRSEVPPLPCGSVRLVHPSRAGHSCEADRSIGTRRHPTKPRATTGPVLAAAE